MFKKFRNLGKCKLSKLDKLRQGALNLKFSSCKPTSET